MIASISRTTGAELPGSAAAIPRTNRRRAASRTRFQGLNLVLRSNVTQYGAGLVGATVCLLSALWWMYTPGASPFWLVTALALGPAAFWLVSSLLVTWWVYDASPLYGLAWLPARLPFPPRRWTVIHAGLDDISGRLERLFPLGGGPSFDVYHPERTTERSIIRARQYLMRTATKAPAEAADAFHLPLADDSIETHFLVLAIHEIRSPEARDRFFAELNRTLRPGGVVVLVEHFRDGWNFLAFGPGFRHFLPRREWERRTAQAGWEKIDETAITPFVHALVLRKPQYAPLGVGTLDRYAAARAKDQKDTRRGARHSIAALHLFDGPR